MSSKYPPFNMNSQREKKRIAHIGITSAEVDDGLDFMSKIIEAMDSQMLHSNAVDSLCKTQEETLNKDPTEHVSAESSKTQLPPRIKMPKPPKKFFPDKKHPLMEKCQRNLKYLKHNRSIPKQRAHVGFIPKSPNLNLPEKQNKFSSKERQCRKLEKKRNIYPRKRNRGKEIIASDNSDSKEIPLDNESDTVFENFIRKVKQTKPESNKMDYESFEAMGSHKKRKRKRKCAKETKKLKSTKSKNIASNCKNTSLVTDMNSDFQHLRSDHFLSSSDESLIRELNEYDSDDASILFIDSDQLSSTESESILSNHVNNFDKDVALAHCNNTGNSINVLPLTFDLNNKETKKYISEHFNCSVQIKRDLVLDEKVRSITTTDVSDQINDDSEVIILENSSDSEDDCQIIYVTPKPNVPPANTVVRLNEENCSNSSLSISRVPSSICKELQTDISNNHSAVADSSEFNIQISNVQSLSNLNNSASLIHTYRNNTNVVNQFNNSCTIDSTATSCRENTEISKSLDENIKSVEDDVQIIGEIKSSASKVLIPNLDELLNNIDFDLINKIREQTSDVGEENYSENSIEKNSDTAIPNGTRIQISSVKNQLSEKCLQTEIKVKTSASEFGSSDILQSNLKGNCDSNGLNSVYDGKNFNSISSDLLGNVISDDNVQQNLEVGNVSQKINYCTGSANYTENLLQRGLKKNSDQLSDMRGDTDLTLFNSSKQRLRPILKDAVTVNKDPNYIHHSSRIIKSDTLSGSQSVSNLAFACDNKINCVNLNRTTSCTNSVFDNKNTKFPINNHSVNGSKLCEVNLFKQEEPYQNVSNELDIIATTSIRELCDLKPDLSPLLNIYNKARKQYDKIVSAEVDVFAGLKDLEEDQVKRIKHIEAAILNLVHRDPCFHKVKEEYLEKQCVLMKSNSPVEKKNACEVPNQDSTLCSTSKISLHEDARLKNAHQLKKKQVQKCDNCGRAAKFRCQQCLKVFYCSKECGIQYWESVHHDSCT